jgi:hypothetical protein
MHGTRLVRTAVAALVLAASPLVGLLPAGANTQGQEGCTPGYWKNHLDAWNDTETDSYSPDDLVGDVFDIPVELDGLADDTLLEALRYKGGPGLEGMARNLLRQSVAAILNVSVDGVDYPYYLNVGDDPVIPETNAALNSGSRSDMETVKDLWEAANELGCPLH